MGKNWKIFLYDYVAVHQKYEIEADNEYVILGNSAIMKCEIPSFVSDLIEVVTWQDDSGNIYPAYDDSSGKFLSILLLKNPDDTFITAPHLHYLFSCCVFMEVVM